MSAVLDVVRLQKRFGSRQVLTDVHLSASSGEAVALVGANGSGKTTTLRAIVGLSQPDGGVIRVNGIDAVRRPREARQHLSYLPQKPAFPSTLTVRETIALVARLRGAAAQVVDRELVACGLTNVAGATVSRLSGGERQRVGIAVTFVADVALYLFDEPSANLDPCASRILLDRAELLVRQGRTVLFTTHVDADLDRLATRVVLLRDGKVVETRAFDARQVNVILDLEDDARTWIAACRAAGGTDVRADRFQLLFTASADRCAAIVEGVRQSGGRVASLKTVGRLERALTVANGNEPEGTSDAENDRRVSADGPARRVWWRIPGAEAHPAGSR